MTDFWVSKINYDLTVVVYEAAVDYTVRAKTSRRASKVIINSDFGILTSES